MYQIDLNCDLGESFGRYTLGLDEQVIPLITSANVACGYHASDPLVMDRTVTLAKEAGVPELWLTHFSPSLVKPKQYIDEVLKIFPNTKLGKDRKSVEFLFDKEK